MWTKESLGYCEFRKHKPWFDKGCSKYLDQRKQAGLRWLQDLSKINWDNLNTVKTLLASRHFRYKKREFPNDKINELSMKRTRT
jgi:hypothetical protein